MAVAEFSVGVVLGPFFSLLDTAGVGTAGEEFDVCSGIRSDSGIVAEVVTSGVLEHGTVEVTVVHA